MNNNDILRRLRYIFGFDDRQMIALFVDGGEQVTRVQVSDWLKRDDDPAFQSLGDAALATFLNGLIIHKRGKRDTPMPAIEDRLNNNIILRKLKIALDLRNDDILRLMTRAGFSIRKPELTAFFRKAGHKHYRECHDQILRNFLKGIQLEYHTESPEDGAEHLPRGD